MVETNDTPSRVSNEDILEEVLRTKELVMASMKGSDNVVTPSSKEASVDDLGYFLTKAKSIDELVDAYSEFKYK